MAKSSTFSFRSDLSRRLSGEHTRYRTAIGDREKTEYQPVYDRQGVWHLEESGKTNVYLEIQSYADSCDINVLMARYRNGETDVLSRVQGVYGDVSAIPTNYAEIMNAKIRAESLFMGLAPGIREKYNNDVTQFMAELGTKEGLEKLGYRFDAPVAEKAAEPTKEESKE